jgi:hypothetical protein
MSEFARQHGVSQQVMHHRCKAGWMFGVLDGKQVIYNPKSVMEVNSDKLECRSNPSSHLRQDIPDVNGWEKLPSNNGSFIEYKFDEDSNNEN